MADDQNIDEVVKDLLGRSIESMTNAEALNHIAAVVDRGADLQSSALTDRAIQLLAELDGRSLSDGHAVLKHYSFPTPMPTAWHSRKKATSGYGRRPTGSIEGTEVLAIYPIGREELAVKTLRVLKLVRAALIYPVLPCTGKNRNE